MSDRGIVLMPRGTLVVGNYDSKVVHGQSRLAAVGLAAYTPDREGNSCVVPLDSAPMADPIGQAGLEGELNTHFWQKFGFALILTALDMGSNIAQAALSNNNSTSGNNTYLSVGNTGGNGVNQFVQKVLQDNMSIKDTIKVNQGSDVMVFLSHPTDFSECAF